MLIIDAMNDNLHPTLPVLLIALALQGFLNAPRCQAQPSPDFEGEVAPLLIRRCLECHNANEPSGGLDLRHLSGLKQGGESGPGLDPANPSQSLLLSRISAGEMPPAKNGKSQALPAGERELLNRWISGGAKWPEGRVLDPYERTTDKRSGRDWWSFQPNQNPEIPNEHAHDAFASPIDAFVHAQLHLNEMEFAPESTRPGMLRRLSYDLIGLPPRAEDIDRFQSDNRPDAYEVVVDRLIQSPEFGKRWARYWLDVARFAETNGYERDAVKPFAWRYRDWVIDALNTNMPYDRFILEQLAGDEVDDRSESTVIATGYLRLGTWDDEPNDPQEYQYDRLEDMVHATATAFLGLTVKCARCHDHKFDPIPQTDYYRMAAAFWAGPIAHRKREWNGGPNAEELGFTVLGWTDLSAQPPELRLLKKGDVQRPGPVVPAGSLTIDARLSRNFLPAPADSKTSQRRLQLARWITDEKNPLTARVQVNRLWQRLMGEGLVRTPDNFGYQGAKPTHPELLDWLANAFVSDGWDVKRTIKRIVMSNTYRQSSVHPKAAEYETKDPNNRLLWRANRRRLDAEALRDSILFVSHRLDFRAGGESFKAPINQEALEGLSKKGGDYQPSPPEETVRRSVYMHAKRSLAVPLMTVFDCCDTTSPAGRREVTIVPPQALTLLNNEAVLAESRVIAQDVLQGSMEERRRLEIAWRTVLGRSPRANEIKAAQKLLRSNGKNGVGQDDAMEAWALLCHVLLNTNEFIFVD